MTYDYSGGWNSATGSNIQLFGDGGSINDTVTRFI